MNNALLNTFLLSSIISNIIFIGLSVLFYFLVIKKDNDNENDDLTGEETAW